MQRTSLLFALTFVTLMTTTASAQSALRPQPSGRGTSEVVLTYPAGQAPAGAQPAVIRLDYGVPHLRGRTLHTADLVPYDIPWRTGANASTTLRTDVDLTIGGTAVPKGTYVLFTLPSRDGWKLIIQRSEAQSATAYEAVHDIARVDLRQTTLAQPLESLTMWLIPSTESGPARGELRYAWGTTQVAVDWVVQ